jgi:phage terminase large subunit-like protein
MIDLPPGTLTGSRFLEGRIPDPLGYGARAVRFIENLQHTEGALAGRPFKLHPWQAKIPRKVFGDVDRHGRRKIRTVFLLWPRGCGKTTMVSALGLLCLLGPEKDAAGQVICAAADRGQASIAFDSACRMVRADPRLSACTRIVTNTKTIHHPKSESIYRAISHESYTKHGLNISCLLADEVHVWPTRDLWEVLTTSQGKRDQPLTIITTTAGVGRTGIAWELYDYALKVERGEIDDPTFLPVLYQAPADCDWRDEALWHAVNPALGKFRSLDEMRRSALRAAQSPVELAAFKRFYLNIWAEANETPWLDMDLYDKSAGERVDLETLRGRRCYIGVDMASKSDLAAVAVAAHGDGNAWIVWVLQYCPEDQVRKRTAQGVPYADWVAAGELLPTPGNAINQDRIFSDVVTICGQLDVRQIGVDRFDTTQFMHQLQERGLPVVQYPQTFAAMNGPCKEIERSVLEAQFRHGGNALLRWNFANVRPDIDYAGNIKFNKARSAEKIDGACAVAMAMGCALADEAPEDIPYYETVDPRTGQPRGLLVLRV